MYSENILRCVLRPVKGITLIMLAAVTVVNCGKIKTGSYGFVEEIVVFADDEDWYNVSDVLSEALEQIVMTPQYEKAFTVSHPTLDNFDFNKRSKMLLLVGTLESKGTIGELLNRSLNDANRNAIKTEKKCAFQQKDVWAENQYMMILAAPTISDLVVRIKENENTIFRVMNDAANELTKKQLYATGEQTKRSDELIKKFNFLVRLPNQYVMVISPEQKIVTIRKNNPDKLLTVHWVDTTEVNEIPHSWIIQKRKELGQTAMDNRELSSKSVTFKKVSFNEYDAVELRGLWEQNEKHIGGPSLIYTFFDPVTSRIYLLDITVFAPERIGEKVKFLRELEVIAKTFTTNVKTAAQK